jgi:hypothetical protein
MTNDFASMKRSTGSNLDRLSKELGKLANNTNQRESDDRFWQPEVDKAGNGYAVIRFLPASKGEDLPWVRIWSHGFQGPGGWYIENSLTTLGQKDPVAELNSKLWNSGSDKDKEIARKQKRRLSYIANIYIVKDPANPQNEGKVKLFKFGKKIFDKINETMTPQYEDEKAINPFDFWAGANFKLKIRNVEGYRNYDKSEFDRPEALSDNDSELESIWASQHALQAFVASDQFKSYSELKARLDRVLGEPTQSRKNDEDDEREERPVSRQSAEPRARSTLVETLPKAASAGAGTSARPPWEDESDINLFERLAQED